MMPPKRARFTFHSPPPAFSVPSPFLRQPSRHSTTVFLPGFSARPFVRKTLRIKSFPIVNPKFSNPRASVSDYAFQDQDVPEPILRAVESLSRQPRQTLPDIAAAAGLPLDSVQLQTAKLAALTSTPIDVTDTGNLAYRFPPNVRQLLRTNSVRAQIRMAWEKVYPLLFTAVRVSFGALLILSIVITFVAIAALSSAARSDDDRRDRSPSMPIRFFAPDIFDIMWYSRRARYYEQRPTNQDMSFLEAVYSFVFGDPDPNQTLESRRYRTIAATIRANNGAVTADQLAPLLDPPLPTESTSVDESFVLPVLQRFQGRPEVTEEGDIIYVFPEFMRTGTATPRIEFAGSQGLKPLIEIERPLTRANGGQRTMVIALGVVNILGVLTLGSKLVGAVPVTSDAVALLALVKAVYPALAAYATSFVVIPLMRFFRLRKNNEGIRLRNRARAAAADKLSRKEMDVSRKIAAAAAYAQKSNVVRTSDVVYSSDADLIEQESVQDELADDFDRRLRQR